MIREYLDGVCASSPWEACLGCEEFGEKKTVTIYNTCGLPWKVIDGPGIDLG